MPTHLYLIHARAAARQSAATRDVGEFIYASCHQRLRGPYTGIDTLLAHILPRALADSPELVERHRFELLYCTPHLSSIIGPAPTTLADTASYSERTRFFGNQMIRCMSQGIVTFLTTYAATCQTREEPPLPAVLFDHLDEADPTCQEFVEILLRRIPANQLRVVVGAAEPISGTLAATLDAHTVQSRAQLDVDESCAIPPLILAERFVTSDAVSDNPQEVAAYRNLDPDTQAGLHDRRADELHSNGAGDLGALAYHREHGSDPRGAGVASLRAAQQTCVDIGFSHAVVDLGYRGRDLCNPTTDPLTYYRLVSHAAAALVPLGRLDESMELYREIRRNTTDQKFHMVISYAIAMMHTRFLTPRDHDQAVEWENNALALAKGISEPRERTLATVFQLNAMALIQMHRGDLSQALSLVEEGTAMLDECLGDAEYQLHRSQLRYNRARLLAALGRTDEAYDAFTELTQLDPYYTDYFSERAKIARKRGDLDSAISDYTRAAELGPPFPELYFNRGTAFAARGDTDHALADFTLVLDMEPNDTDTRVARAELLIETENLSKARIDIDYGLSQHREDPRFLCLQGAIAIEAGRFLEAIEALDAALVLDPDYVAALAVRATANFNIDNLDSAIKDLTSALDLAGPDPDLLLNRGIAHRASGQLTAAQDDFSHALTLADADTNALLHQQSL